MNFDRGVGIALGILLVVLLLLHALSEDVKLDRLLHAD
jgi:hypothetical protein